MKEQEAHREDLPEEMRLHPLLVTLPVQWGDMDAFGHVNGVVYFRWFESARVDYFHQSGLGHLMSSHALGPILASIKGDYRSQLKYPDTVRVTATITGVGNTSLQMAHAVQSVASGKIVALAQSVIVMFDYKAQQPTRVPDDVRAKIEQFEKFSDASQKR